MPNVAVLQPTEIVELIHALDHGRTAPDPFRSPSATPQITNLAHRHPTFEAPLAPWGRGAGGEGFLITAQLAIVNANQSRRAGSGTAQAASAARDLALGKLQTMNDRIRWVSDTSPKRQRGNYTADPR